MKGRAGPQGEITLRKLQAFAAVAQAGSMTAAARQLGVAQPTLSQLIAGLEAQSGTQLFLREGGGMVLSDAGEALLRKAESVIDQFEDFTTTLESLSHGRPVNLKVAALPSVMRMLVPQTVARMREVYPGVNLDGHEHAPGMIVDLLYRRTVHVGIAGAYSVPELSSAFTRVEIYADPIVLVSPPDAPDDLPFLHVDLGGAASQRMAMWFEERFPRVRSIMHLRNYETAVRFAEEGLGRCVVPLLSYIDSHGGRRMEVHSIPDLPKRRLEAILPQTHLRLPAYAAFVDHLKDVANARIGAVAERVPLL